MAQEPEGYGGYQGYGGYGAPMDPASMRARLAMAMLQQGSDSSPIRSPWQGAARMSNALFGALMMRQMQDARSGSWNDVRGTIPTGGGLASGGTPAAGAAPPPNTLSNFAQNPAMVADVFKNIPADTFAGAGGEMGPPMPTMAPNNSAGGLNIPGYIGGAGAPGGNNAGGPPPANMTAALPASMQHNMMVAGPGAPSTAPPLPPSGPASGNGPQGADAGGSVPFNPSELAPFQKDVQGFVGTAPPGGGAGAGGGVLEQLKANIAGTESRGQPNGGYGAIGPPTNGDRPFGKYQVMGNNIPSWTQAALGQAMTPQEFLNNPQAQEAVVNHRLGGYLQQYGPAGAARAWFTGSPVGKSADVNGMTGDRYAALATQGLGGGGVPPAPGALAFNGGPPPASPAVAAIQGAAGPPGGINGPPASMQPNMMVAGPGVPSGARGGNPNMPPPMPPPGGGDGGNPLEGLQNMFGVGNPSSPQGGNGPAPAVGGAPGGMNDPRAQKLFDVMSNPYADPEAKRWAEQIYQTYYMPHPKTWQEVGGGKQAFDQWGNPVQGNGNFIPDIKSQVIGKDMYGNDRYGIVNPRTGQVTPLNTGGQTQPQPLQPLQGGAPPSAQPPLASQSGPGVPPAPGQSSAPTPPVSPPGSGTTDIWASKYVPGYNTIDQLTAKNPQLAPLGDLAKQILRGDASFPEANTRAGTSQYDANLRWLVNQADPNFSVSRAKARNDTIKQFQTGTDASSPGGLLLNANTALAHLGEVAKASEALGKFQVGAGPYGVGAIYNHLPGGGQPYQDAHSAYETALGPFIDEMGKFFAGGGGTNAMRESLETGLAADSTPEARRSAISTFAKQMQDKATELQGRWHMSMGDNVPDYPVISPQAQSSLAYIQNMGGRTGSGQGQSAPNASGGAQAAPAPSGFAHQGTAGGPVIIKSDDDYNRLPSGAKFIGPDGKTRAKP